MLPGRRGIRPTSAMSLVPMVHILGFIISSNETENGTCLFLMRQKSSYVAKTSEGASGKPLKAVATVTGGSKPGTGASGCV